MNDALLRIVLIVIAAITVITGAAQLFAAPKLLEFIATSFDPLAEHLFGTVGMFMVITGSMFFQTLMTRSKESAVPFWIMAQKLAAAALVSRAWLLGLFAPISLGVAAFDALTALLVFLFWRRLKS